MDPPDVVAIASASGQIGFLQQFTDHQSVPRAAIGRLNHRPYTIHDTEAVAMAEYNALRVEQGDRDAITYFTNQLLLADNFRRHLDYYELQVTISDKTANTTATERVRFKVE